jgi:hypothetical protein
MLGGYLEFFMKPAVAEMYLSLKRGLEELMEKKVRIYHFSQITSQMHLYFQR